jgi:hypothetical protein
MRPLDVSTPIASFLMKKVIDDMEARKVEWAEWSKTSVVG